MDILRTRCSNYVEAQKTEEIIVPPSEGVLFIRDRGQLLAVPREVALPRRNQWSGDVEFRCHLRIETIRNNILGCWLGLQWTSQIGGMYMNREESSREISEKGNSGMSRVAIYI